MKRPPEDIANGNRKRKCVNNSVCESSSSVPLVEGDIGIIESVSVTNFMCHENLTVKFEPHMNFIIGQNGSGKSAILTAIILALGGKSSSTDRFANIKGFVKNGKNKAKIEIVLRNEGDVPYLPQTYGKKIIIIREFNKEGVSSYKIKSESGTICSNTKLELTNILDWMGIMVECPVCVLTQATSKRFLISKDAKAERLFEFFYKGTGLESLELSYKTSRNLKEQGEAELDKKKQSLPALKKELRKWKRFLDSSKKISDYKNELIWANVIAMEKAIQEKEESHRKIEEEFEEHKRILEGCKKSFAEKSSELDELNKQKSELVAEMEDCRKKIEELKAGHEQHASSHRKNMGTLQRLQNERKKLKDDITGLEKCIEEQKQKDQRDLEEAGKRRQEAIQHFQAKNVSLEDKLKISRETINTKRSEHSNFGILIQKLRDEVTQNGYEIQGINNNLIALKNAIKSKVNAFGEHTEKVLFEIKNEKKFRKPPIGPLGLYLEVKDPKWATVVEFATSSNLLNGFCVDNHQDSQLLRGILRKYYNKLPTIIVSRYETQMFDVRHGRVHSTYPSVLDMLEIKHHLVANCLIDQASIEKKILVEDEKADLLRNPPKNCKTAYFKNCDQICFNPYRYYSSFIKMPRSRLSAIRTEDITNLEKIKEEKMANITEKNKQIGIMVNAQKQLPEKIEELEGEVVKISTEYKRNLMEIKELQCTEQTKDVNCLQEDLQPLYHSCEQKEIEIEQQSEVVAELETKKLDLGIKINTLSTQLKSLDGRFQTLHTKISNVSKLKENFASGKRKYELEFKSKENKCKMDQKTLEDSKCKLDIMRSKAESTCPRIMTERSSEDIKRLIAETERVVQAQSNCSGENLINKYKEKLENLNRAEAELQKLEKYNSRLEEMLMTREANFQKIRKNTELLIGLTFNTICSGNGYVGHLRFDQINRTLTMDVSTRASDQARKNHGSLSGGERSFITIAFLLSLWERTQMPFRVLDEYDVFMDSSNRQLSFDLLCKKAEEMAQTQFIYLSPLELPRMTRMPATNHLNIFKLTPPKRKGEDDNSPRKKRS